jgi:hypothetical protein
MTICTNCKLPGTHANGHECAGAQAEATLALLKNVGDRAVCSGCGAEIYWVHHKNGKRAPYTPAGLNHFVDCPKAAQFQTRKVSSNG